MPEPDALQQRIERFNPAKGGGLVVERRQGGYSLFEARTGTPVARLKPTGTADHVTVLYWSDRGKWSQIGDFGGIVLPLDEALAYIASEPIFWR